MRDKLSYLNSRTQQVIIYVFLSVVFGFIFSYALVGNEFLVMKDQWRFISILQENSNGTLDFWDLWYSHSEHRKPGYRFLFLLNAIFFDLDLRLEAILGIIFLLFSSLLVWNYWRDIASKQNRPLLYIAVSLAIITIICSFNQRTSFRFTLLTLGGFIGQYMTILGAYKLDSILRQRSFGTIRRVMLWSLFIIIATWSFVGARGPILWLALLASAGFFLLMEVVEGRMKTNELVRYTGLLVLATMISQVVYWAGNVSTKGIKESIDVTLLDRGWFMSSIMGRSLLDYNLLFDYKASSSGAMLIGLVVIALYALALFLYIYQKQYRKGFLPVFLMAYSFLFMIAILFSRLSIFGIGVANSSRYVFDTHLGLVGVFLIFGRFAIENKRFRNGLYILVMLMIGLNAWTVLRSFVQKRSITKMNNRVEVKIAKAVDQRDTKNKFNIEFPRWYCPNNDLCNKEIQYLYEHELNMFDR